MLLNINKTTIYKGLAVAVLVLALAGCKGSSSSDSSAPDEAANHYVPGWLIGEWRLYRMYPAVNQTSMDIRLIITDTGFTYEYPNCNVSGVLRMSTHLPWWASNNYTLEMTDVVCDQQWDIYSAAGEIDFGHLWSDEEGLSFWRISDKHTHNEVLWLYHKIQTQTEPED